jgi:hypothetical protein
LAPLLSISLFVWENLHRAVYDTQNGTNKPIKKCATSSLTPKNHSSLDLKVEDSIV